MKIDYSVRAGIAFSLTSFGALFGTPVTGALLGNTFPWWRTIVFSGVRFQLRGNVV
jgi:hypothetical protein